jgi:lysophospholipid hydrolase
VQIFVKSSRESDQLYDDSRADLESEDSQEAGSQGYQLLTEVKNGAPMSSLFSILSLFTEDIKLRHQDSDDDHAPSNEHNGQHQQFSGDFEAHDLNTAGISPTTPNHTLATSFQHHVGRANGRDEPSISSKLPTIPPLSLETQDTKKRLPYGPSSAGQSPPVPSLPKQKSSFHPDILARATVDTTIAIIPATAFRRLTRVYPKAIAHIVQVILTRLQRVTLATGHSYLGLTSEVLRTEKHMNRYTTYELPPILQGGALERLKEKFQKERERIGPEEGMKGIALHNARSKTRRKVSRSNFSQSLKTDEDLAGRGVGSLGLTKQKTNGLPLEGGAGVSPGDLLTSVTDYQAGSKANHPSFPIGSIPFGQPFQGTNSIDFQSPLAQRSFRPFTPARRPGLTIHRQESLDEDSILRGSILECMFKAIGLQDTSNSLQKAASVEQSPRMVSYDSMRQKAVFTHAFGLMNQSEGSADGDAESTTSIPVSNASFGGAFSRTGLIDELRDDVEIVYFPKDSVLVEQGERNPGLYFLIDGFLDVSTPAEEGAGTNTVLGSGYGSSVKEDFSLKPPRPNSGSSRNAPSSFKQKRQDSGRQNLFLIKPGGIAGYIGTISSYRSFIDVRAKTDVYVGFLPRTALERIVEKYPVVLLTMAKRMTSLLPRLILHIDFALEWVQVSAGQVIYHQNDDSDAIFIVLNGRLRALYKAENDEMRVVGEYGQGESVGELEVLTESSRPATLHAIRDTELAKFPKTLFNSLALEHPGITIKISKIIASRMRALIENPLLEHCKERSATAASKNVTSTLNMRTVAILPVTAGVPVVEFGSRLMNALTQVGATNGVTSLNQAAILNHLGRHAFSRMGKLKLSQYLADLEEAYGLVLYVADTNVNAPWTQTCISQADCILLVGLAEDSPNIGEYERFLLGMKTTARKELVLLHLDRYVPVGLTRSWLKNRMWINGGHHHIQMEFRTSTGPVNPQAKRFGSALIGSALKQRVQVLQAEIQRYTSRKVRQTPLYSSETPFKGDFHRLARRLCGKSVGLVLGGGGARGLSHIGVIRALEEAGLPVDIIGGTSIGAFIGALYARNAGVVPMYGRAKKFAGRMASMWRFALDLTYPS